MNRSPDDPAADEPLPGAATDAPSLTQLRRSVDQLNWQRQQVSRELRDIGRQRTVQEDYLAIADQVSTALDELSQTLFEEILDLLRDKLSIAIQEVLEQPIRFQADASFKRGAANVDFSIDREGNQEDVNRGQGGSVQNVLSVGLRLFALASLDEQEHRRFLVLDEQDCWLRPELVPRLVHIVYRAARELNFQVIMISHHDVRLFEKYADRIYRFEPTDSGVEVRELIRECLEPDQEPDA